MNTIRNAILAASTVFAFGALAAGPALATTGVPEVDPYTYDYSAGQNVRADVGSMFDTRSSETYSSVPMVQGVYDVHGSLKGFEPAPR